MTEVEKVTDLMAQRIAECIHQVKRIELKRNLTVSQSNGAQQALIELFVLEDALLPRLKRALKQEQQLLKTLMPPSYSSESLLDLPPNTKVEPLMPQWGVSIDEAGKQLKRIADALAKIEEWPLKQ